MISSVRFRITCHATEDPKKVKKALDFVCPSGKLETRNFEGHHGNPIILLEKEIEDIDTIRNFWERMKQAGILATVLDELDSRLDESGHIFLRLDKEEAFCERLSMGTGDEVIQVRTKLIAYPANLKNFRKAAQEYFASL